MQKQGLLQSQEVALEAALMLSHVPSGSLVWRDRYGMVGFIRVLGQVGSGARCYSEIAPGLVIQDGNGIIPAKQW